MKKILIAISSIILLLMLFLVSFPFLFKKQIHSKIESTINSKINAKLTFSDLSFSMFRHFPNIGCSIHDLKCQSHAKFSNDTIAYIKELDVELNILTFLKNKELEVTGIHLINPIIYTEVLKNGNANYDIAIPDTISTKDTTSSNLNLKLDNVQISNGRIEYFDHTNETYVALRGFNFKGEGDFQKDIFDLETKSEIDQLTLDYGQVRYLNDKYVFSEMILEVNNKENKYTFKENEFHVNHFKFGIEGFIALLENDIDMDLNFQTKETSFKTILSLVPGVYKSDFNSITTKGNLNFNGFIKGKYNDSLSLYPAFHLGLKMDDAMFKVDSLPTEVTNIDLDLVVDNAYGNLDSTIIDLKSFHMDMGKYPMHGQLKCKGVDNPYIDGSIAGNIELSELVKIFPIKGLSLKGNLDYSLSAKGKYDALTKDTVTTYKEIPTFDLNVTLKDGFVKYNHLPKSINNIHLQLLASNKDGNIENTSVDLNHIKMNFGKNPFSGYAKVKGFTKYIVDADIKTSLDLADIESIYPIDSVTIKGMFNLDCKANGVYDTKSHKLPAIDAHINLVNGYVKSLSYPEPIENIHFVAEAINTDGNYKDTEIKLQKVTYTLEDEPFEISGIIKDLEQYAYDLKIKGAVDLAKVTKIYPIDGVQLSGLIDSDIEVNGTVADLEAGKYKKVKSEGYISFKDIKASGSSLPQGISIKDALFTFTPEKVILERFTGKFGKSNVQLHGDLTNYMSFLGHNHKKVINGDLKLDCDTLDLNEWISDQAGSQPNATASTTNKAAAANASSPSIGVWEVPKFLDFVFDSDIGFVKFEDMVISKLDGEIRMKDGVLSLSETGFNTLEAQFSISGDYNTQDLNHPLFDFLIDIKELDINRAYKEIKLMRDLAPAAADTKGIFSINYKLKGELKQDMTPLMNTLVGGGELRIADAEINGMKMFEEISRQAKKKEINNPHLKDVVIKSEIKDNKLFVMPFSLKVSGFDTDIEGVNELDGTILYIVKIELLPISKLKIPFHVKGTYDNPKIELGKGHTIPE